MPKKIEKQPEAEVEFSYIIIEQLHIGDKKYIEAVDCTFPDKESGEHWIRRHLDKLIKLGLGTPTMSPPELFVRGTWKIKRKQKL